MTKQKDVHSSVSLSKNYITGKNVEEPNEKKFAVLPCEVIDQIINYLETVDLFECMCTSSTFNMVFRPFLYRTAVLNSKRQFGTFLKTVGVPTILTWTDTTNNSTTLTRAAAATATATTPGTLLDKRQRTGNIPYITNLGENVRSLEFEDHPMSADIMENVAKACPNVASLRFKWVDFPDYRNMYIPKKPDLSALYFLLRAFQPSILTSLTLNRSIKLHMNGYRERLKVIVLLALCYVPLLKSLTLDIDSLLITLSDLEELHRLCPKLQQFECSPRTQLQRTEFDLSPGTIRHTIEPAKAMKKLSMANRFWTETGICTTPWWLISLPNTVQSKL